MARISRIKVAESVARNAFFFVKRAREAGCVNMIDEMCLIDAGVEMGHYYGTHYSISTAKTAVRNLADLFGMSDLIKF